LFQYVDADGRRQSIGSADVNAYVREITGQPFTSKDFRTWGGTVLAACELAHTTSQRTKRGATKQIVNAIKAVAQKLGNTAAVCKKCYIHPAVLDAYARGSVIRVRPSVVADGKNALRPEEKAVVDLIFGERDSIEGRPAFHSRYAR
jgi:DNA topoisomerase I